MTNGRITVQLPGTSPEVEWVVIVQEDEWFVTIGSDHTDRELEKTDPRAVADVSESHLSFHMADGCFAESLG